MTLRNATLLVALLTAILASVAPARAADGGTDAGADGDTDSDPADPCYLDNGSEAEAGALLGCNGPPPGPPSGSVGAECSYDSLDFPYFDRSDTCNASSTCYPASQWYRTADLIVEQECGLCFRRCTRVAGCPDGYTDQVGQFDFCSSQCPEGTRCWLAGDNGVCVIDCLGDYDCASGVCDPAWNICVPRDASCPVEDDTDSDSATDSDSDSSSESEGAPDGDGSVAPEAETGGCACRAVSGADRSRALLAELLELLVHGFQG